MKINILSMLFLFILSSSSYSQKLLVPMDLSQTDHLKAYGITYWTLTEGHTADWLLNYRGGAFILDATPEIEAECRIRGVSFENIDGATQAQIYSEIQQEDINQDIIRLQKAPKIAVYAPPGSQPWDDAVRLALEYAEVKHEIIWDEEVLNGKLKEYDWIHLHHEDFTGQYGKFYASFANQPWYIQQVTLNEAMAQKMGFSKVSDMKLAVAKEIQSYIAAGGFLFAMCSATDSYDIALASHGTDICGEVYDGDNFDTHANSHLDFTQTLAFENFSLKLNPFEYEFSDIDVRPENGMGNPETDWFTLFDFSAKYDPVPTMLTQCHVNIVQGFLGQTTAFHKEFLKKSVVVMGIREGTDEVKYIHGNYGKGTFTWYGGHDPEDYRHAVGDPPTDLNLHRNSPGYRLILNNILFPAAKKKKQKT